MAGPAVWWTDQPSSLTQSGQDKRGRFTRVTSVSYSRSSQLCHFNPHRIWPNLSWTAMFKNYIILWTSTRGTTRYHSINNTHSSSALPLITVLCVYDMQLFKSQTRLVSSQQVKCQAWKMSQNQFGPLVSYCMRPVEEVNPRTKNTECILEVIFSQRRSG